MEIQYAIKHEDITLKFLQISNRNNNEEQKPD